MRTVLVVANETLGGQTLIDRAREESAKGDVRIVLCVPRKIPSHGNVIYIDQTDQGKLEAGDFVAAFDQRVIEWIDIQEIGRLVANRAPGRQSPQDVTLFKSLGIGLEDIAVAARVLAKAKEAGIGKWLEL